MKEQVAEIIVNYHLDAEKAIANQIEHYPSIIEAQSKILNLFKEVVEKLTIEIKDDLCKIADGYNGKLYKDNVKLYFQSRVQHTKKQLLDLMGE